MKKQQIVFIHGGEAWNSRENFVEYLKTKEVTHPLEEKPKRWKHSLQDDLGDAYEVLFLSMPLGEDAKYEEWKIWFERNIQFFDDEVVLIGHSLGANFLAKYLAENTFSKHVEALYLIAGCFGYAGDFELPDNLSNVEQQADNIFIYHSHDDPVVPFSDAEKYKELLPRSQLIEFQDRGHLLQEEFPELVVNIKKT